MGIANHELRFRQWLGEHTGLLLKVVRSFAAEPAEQDDLFQEVLLQVWLSLPNFRDDSKPTTWLYRVALNTALTWKRTEKKHRRTMNSVSVADVALPSPASAEAEQNTRLLDRLYAAIRTLPRPNALWLSCFSTAFPTARLLKSSASRKPTSASA